MYLCMSMQNMNKYDLLVIGGGSGGLACAKAAADLGKRVALCDFVTPSPLGTTWGLGGTCVNVGCIPKKIMHYAAMLGQSLSDSRQYGWKTLGQATHDWKALLQGVANHIKSLNFGYRAELMNKKITYYNAHASFLTSHTVKLVDGKGDSNVVEADAFVVAVGTRPRYPNFPGAKEYCITSDDFFSLEAPPGKTLVVGASYVALECAGILNGLGFHTTVAMRSIPLRGFDQEMAGCVVKYMQTEGVHFMDGVVPTRVERLNDGRKRVEFSDATVQEFDTVLLATGRDACTKSIGLELAGVMLNERNGKIPTINEQTNIKHIYAIGDVIDGDALDPPSAQTELTPVAIQAGSLLAHRLYGGSARYMNYEKIPTTVFTPLEYGACGLSEEDANRQFRSSVGSRIEVFHLTFKPIEWALPHRGDGACYLKIICDKFDSMRVLGLHICGPNAAEVVQGFAVAMRMGATKDDIDATVGIHPSVAEEFTTLTTTKSSGLKAEKAGC